MEKNEISKSVLILGASLKPTRYSNKAAKALKEKGHKIYAIGRSKGKMVNGVEILSSLKELDKETEIHTVSVYLNEENQSEYEDAIIAMKPKRVIFNPGAENGAFFSKLSNEGIEALNACTLVMLSLGNF